ncbi:OmpA family protein [Thalassobius sp. S69A]|uniref:OmpA family protein n=1 Tax=unclassified Thalassovita TaxID=2619711 RepID=UPI000C0DE4B6|nr:hypothetical protein [Paracoccaceae bacterium]MBT25824.1 hypothetical protein [Paracoccaceae bacterium]
MRLSSLATISATFGVAAGLCLIGAGFAVNVIEDNSELGVRRALDARDLHWTEVHANGLQVFLTGTAPSEAIRFNAITTAGTVVDAARVIDNMTVKATDQLHAPRFSVEILRNDTGVSLIGLVPAETDRSALMQNIHPLAANGHVTDLLETADYPVPEGWEDALQYALKALKSLPRSKVSVAAGAVEIRAMSDSAESKQKLEASLQRFAPGDMDLMLEITAPRPVITPFTLRFVMDGSGPHFDACSAETDASRARILAAAQKAGLTGDVDCTIGLGVPSPTWAQAVETAIAALTDLGQGSITFSDADVTLVAAEGTAQGLFDRTVGELENALPEVFALHSILPVPEKTDAATEVPEFTATLSPEGLVQLRGRLNNDLTRTAAETFAKARFGSAQIYNAARLDDTLPSSWSLRTLTALDGLSQLSNGYVSVTPTLITLSGKTGNTDAKAEIARLFSEKLGETERYALKVDYVEALDPVASIPTPDECEAEIAEILKTRKINFEPSSDKPDAEAAGILDDIAEILKECGEIRMEIAGHTDSQGREEMNLALSQRRAQAVLNALRARRVLTSAYIAQGYGEARPIADNDTAEGRDANRRIEFSLIRPEPVAEQETTLESVAKSADEQAQQVDPADAAAEGGSNDE